MQTSTQATTKLLNRLTLLQSKQTLKTLENIRKNIRKHKDNLDVVSKKLNG